MDKLLEFEQGIIGAERPFDGSLKAGEINYYDIEKLITDDNCQLIVAHCVDQLIGCGYALIKKSEPFEKHAYFAYLGFMFVDPQYRRMGVNKKIIDSLLD